VAAACLTQLLHGNHNLLVSLPFCSTSTDVMYHALIRSLLTFVGCVCVLRVRLLHMSGQVDTLYAGEVGYLAAQIKSVQDARVGDTVTISKQPAAEALDGYEDVQPMVYCGLFPTDADDYQVGVARENFTLSTTLQPS